MVHNSIITQNSESFIRLFHTADQHIPRYTGIGLTVSSELRIIYHVYSPLLILYRANLINIYRGIGLTVSELRIFYSPL